MLIEIHMLKNYPPTNLNRGENGEPKTCTFGGTSRARISSQCLKRSWRHSEIFRTEIGAENMGIRTKYLPAIVAERLLQLGVDPAFVEAVKPKIAKFGKSEEKEAKNGEDKKESSKDKEEKDQEKTAQLIFFAPADIDAISKAVKEKLDTCKTVADVKKLSAKDLENAASDVKKVRAITIDISIFGRMVTSDIMRNVDAALQVSHAISTNKVKMETDFYTAMDDKLDGKSMDTAGAAHLDDTDFNSSCYYLYAALDTDLMEGSLQDADLDAKKIAKIVMALLITIAFTNPSGKQNAFAGHVLPSCFMVECKEKKVQTNLVNAFAEAVKSNDIVGDSIRKLADETDMVARDFGLEVKERIWFCVDKYQVQPSSATKVCETFMDLVKAVGALLS